MIFCFWRICAFFVFLFLGTVESGRYEAGIKIFAWFGLPVLVIAIFFEDRKRRRKAKSEQRKQL